MLTEKIKHFFHKVVDELFSRLTDQRDHRHWIACLRWALRFYPFAHILYHFRQGNIGRARQLIAGRRPRTDLEKRLFARIEEISSAVEKGAPFPPRRKRLAPVSWNEKVLLALHSSLPYDPAGYAIRSHSILKHLRLSGLDVLAVTRLNYPWDLVQHSGKPYCAEDLVDGLRYVRLTDSRDLFSYPDSEYLAAYAGKLAEVMEKHGAAVVHAASNYLNGLAAARAAGMIGGRSIFEMRGLWHLSRAVKEPGYEATDLFRYDEIMEVAAAREADRVVTISEALKNWLVAAGIAAGKITVVPNAVDISLFEPQLPDLELKKQLGLEGRTVVGFIGSLTDYEGLDLLVEAVAALEREGANLALLLVGKGYAEAGLRKLVSSLTGGAAIHFAGYVPFADIKKYYSIIDIFPFPRRGYEVCRIVPPLKILEVMAMAKPVIISDLPALREMVEEGKTGDVCQADDLQALKDSIRRLYERPEERTMLGKAARKWVEENRSWEDNARRYLTLYEEVCRN